MVNNTIGKHKHMTYMVGVDNRGACTDVELLVFREAKGSEVRRKRFNAQYEGKTVSDPIRINKDIINISGATMSVRSISAGVKRVLVLVDEFYLKPAGMGSDTVGSKKIGARGSSAPSSGTNRADDLLSHAQLQHPLPSPRLRSSHPAGLHLLSLLMLAGFTFSFFWAHSMTGLSPQGIANHYLDRMPHSANRCRSESWQKLPTSTSLRCRSCS